MLLPALAGTLILALVALIVVTLWSARTGYIRTAQVTTRNLVRVLEEQTARTVQAVDATLASFTGIWAEIPPHLRPSAPGIHRLLREKARTGQYIRSVYVLDARGVMAYDSETFPARAIDFSDRDYFDVHLQGDRGLYVSNMMRDRLTGRWSIVLSRRLSDAKGRFAGVVVAALEPLQFETVYRGIDIGTEGLINLRHVQGELIARVPQLDGTIGQKIASTPMLLEQIARKGAAAGELRSVFDRIDRIYSAAAVPDTPLMVFVGLSKDDVLAPWYRSVAAYGLVAVLLVVVLAWLTQLLVA